MADNKVASVYLAGGFVFRLLFLLQAFSPFAPCLDWEETDFFHNYYPHHNLHRNSHYNFRHNLQLS